MKQPRTISRVFGLFDRVAEHVLSRPLSGDEKALAHSAIFQATSLSSREGIPFSSALEKLFPRLPAREVHPETYQLIRRLRGKIEILLNQPSGVAA